MAPRWFCIALTLAVLATAAFAQNDNAMAYGTPSKGNFVNMPNLPDCMKVAVQRGDPTKGPSVLLLKFQAGCNIPWHWHTAAETLIIVNGNGTMQMKDGQPMPAKQGDFVYLPGKNIHTFTANTSLLLYDLPDGAFDIHYVDKAGNEIPFGDAVKAGIKVKPAAGPTTTVPR